MHNLCVLCVQYTVPVHTCVCLNCRAANDKRMKKGHRNISDKLKSRELDNNLILMIPVVYMNACIPVCYVVSQCTVYTVIVYHIS